MYNKSSTWVLASRNFPQTYREIDVCPLSVPGMLTYLDYGVLILFQYSPVKENINITEGINGWEATTSVMACLAQKKRRMIHISVQRQFCALVPRPHYDEIGPDMLHGGNTKLRRLCKWESTRLYEVPLNLGKSLITTECALDNIPP